MKALFMHIPKTAGSSLLSSDLGGAIDKRIHSFVGSIDDIIREYSAEDHFKFCFTRNPYDRFCSLYYYFRNMTEDHMFYKYNGSILKLVKRYDTFEEFCLAFPELKIKNFHFYSQSKYMYSNGNLILDYVGSMENLAEDVAILCDKLGVVQRNPIPHSNKSNSIDYRDVYSSKMKRVVEEAYAEDIEKLGYRF